MNRLRHILRMLAAVLWAGVFAPLVLASDLSQTVILVASSGLDGSPFEQSVVLVTPLPDGGHFGFIINRPTTTRLETLFPDDVGARQVVEPVYLGGPGMLPGVFALTRVAPESGGTVLPLMPGLVAVLDSDSIDHVIAATPNEARYFLGLMAWDAGELERQVEANQWEVRPADVDVVLRPRTRGLWDVLRRHWVLLDSAAIRSAG